MDLNDTPELAEYRTQVRAWLDEHAAEAPQRRGREDMESVAAHREWQRKLADAGLAAVTWPAEYGGQGLGPLHQVVVNQEIGRAGVPGLFDVIGVGMLGPTLIAHGTEDQKQRHLGPMLAGEEVWCQLFSEPAAGSDLAGIQARAKRAGRRHAGRVSGQKVWTTNAQHAAFGLLLARTDADVPKHSGPDDVRAADGRRGRERAPAAPDLRRRALQRGLLRRRRSSSRAARSARSTAAGASR